MKKPAAAALERKAQDTLRRMTTGRLLDLWELTTHNHDPNIPTVRGWLMDELETRNPEGFYSWLDGPARDEDLRRYI